MLDWLFNRQEKSKTMFDIAAEVYAKTGKDILAPDEEILKMKQRSEDLRVERINRENESEQNLQIFNNAFFAPYKTYHNHQEEVDKIVATSIEDYKEGFQEYKEKYLKLDKDFENFKIEAYIAHKLYPIENISWKMFIPKPVGMYTIYHEETAKYK